MAMQVGPASNFVGTSALWTKRWYPLKYLAEHDRLWRSQARFRTVPAGRRSGKTEIAKRYGVTLAMKLPPGGLVGFGAPTFNQAKNIFWSDLKKMVPKQFVKAISETELKIVLITGTEIRVIGMDMPQRVEGQPWDWLCLDEFANMKETAWMENVYPALSTVGKYGRAWLIGVPEGRNHYYELDLKAKHDESGEWDSFTWFSSEILPAATIEAAKRDLDELTYQQEYEASFVNFAGRAYHAFEHDGNVRACKEKYNKRAPLMFCFDFNVEPGTASVAQHMKYALPRKREAVIMDGKQVFGEEITFDELDVVGIIDEVWQPRNSNTLLVCNKLIEMYKDHEGRIDLFGDATGGARKTSSITDGTDWDIILRTMYAHYGRDRVRRHGHQNNSTGKWSNPSERARVNAVNSLLRTAAGTVRLIVDSGCPQMIKDFDGVRLVEGGSGEIDKKFDPQRTHLSDGAGYMIERLYPTREKRGVFSTPMQDL